MTTLQPRAFRRNLKEELLKVFEQARHLADEFEWATNAAHSATVGDEAKVRTVAARPTEAVALHGHLELDKDDNDPSERDRIVRGKAALRRQMEKSQRHALQELIKIGNVLDGESKKLERAMGHLKPGPSVKNPTFEPTVRGDMKLPGEVIRELEEAQARRGERGEGFGG